jgi:hypothetical protein
MKDNNKRVERKKRCRKMTIIERRRKECRKMRILKGKEECGIITNVEEQKEREDVRNKNT